MRKEQLQGGKKGRVRHFPGKGESTTRREAPKGKSSFMEGKKGLLTPGGKDSVVEEEPAPHLSTDLSCKGKEKNLGAKKGAGALQKKKGRRNCRKKSLDDLSLKSMSERVVVRKRKTGR